MGQRITGRLAGSADFEGCSRYGFAARDAPSRETIRVVRLPPHATANRAVTAGPCRGTRAAHARTRNQTPGAPHQRASRSAPVGRRSTNATVPWVRTTRLSLPLSSARCGHRGRMPTNLEPAGCARPRNRTVSHRVVETRISLAALRTRHRPDLRIAPAATGPHGPIRPAENDGSCGRHPPRRGRRGRSPSQTYPWLTAPPRVRHARESVIERAGRTRRTGRDRARLVISS